jgi:hypothetical protein
MDDDSLAEDITTAASQSSDSDEEEADDGISLAASERSLLPHHPAHAQTQPSSTALGEAVVPQAAMDGAVDQPGASLAPSTAAESTPKPAESRLKLLDLPLDILKEILKEVK